MLPSSSIGKEITTKTERVSIDAGLAQRVYLCMDKGLNCVFDSRAKGSVVLILHLLPRLALQLLQAMLGYFPHCADNGCETTSVAFMYKEEPIQVLFIFIQELPVWSSS